MVLKAARDCFALNNWKQIHCINTCYKRSCLDLSTHWSAVWLYCKGKMHTCLLQQQICYCFNKGPSISHKNKAYWYSVSFYLLVMQKQYNPNHLLSYWRNGHWYTDQSSPFFEGEALHKGIRTLYNLRGCVIMQIA